MRFIFPIILIFIAGVVFFVFTNPLIGDPVTIDPTTEEMVGGVVALQQEKETLEAALADARALKSRIGELDSKLASISDDQIRRLDDFLPDQPDEIQLIVDVNNVALRSGMRVSDLNTNPGGSGRNNAEDGGDDPSVMPMSLGFTVSGSYSQLRRFVEDIAGSLRIMDLDSISFSLSQDEPVTQYNMELTTYWLK